MSKVNCAPIIPILGGHVMWEFQVETNPTYPRAKQKKIPDACQGLPWTPKTRSGWNDLMCPKAIGGVAGTVHCTVTVSIGD